MQRGGLNICILIWEIINGGRNVSQNNPYMQKIEFKKYMTYWKIGKEQSEFILSSRLYI